METTQIPIASLVARVQSGDGEAFDELCRELEPRLLRQAMVLCGDPGLAEDIAQDTWLVAWKNRHRFNGQCQWFTWLCGILLNCHRARRRKERLLRWLPLGRRDGLNDNDEEGQAHDSATEASPPSPDRTIEAKERAAILSRCLMRLSAKHRDVIYLRFYVDDSLTGIAAALHCSVGTVKSRLFHALERLRALPEVRDHILSQSDHSRR